MIIIEDSPFQGKYLGGFSFGGAASLLAKNPNWPRILIAPAWHLMPASTIFSNFNEILLIHTIDDTVVSPAESWNHFQKLNAQEKKFFVYGEGGHFFQDQLESLKMDLSIYYQQLLSKLFI
jgi:alpha/beta superfamily hydrolase